MQKDKHKPMTAVKSSGREYDVHVRTGMWEKQENLTNINEYFEKCENSEPEDKTMNYYTDE